MNRKIYIVIQIDTLKKIYLHIILLTQDSKLEPWRSEAEHATSRSRGYQHVEFWSEYYLNAVDTYIMTLLIFLYLLVI